MVKGLDMEDTAADAVAKAQRGLAMDDDELARIADLRLIELQALKEGKASPDVLLRAASAVGLDPTALEKLARGWHPNRPVNTPHVRVFTSPRPGRSPVNAYFVWDPASNNAVALDAGTDAGPMLKFAAEHHIRLQMVLLTHSHPSHVAALSSIVAATDARGFISKEEAFPGAETFESGRNFRVGNLVIATKLTRGHSAGGTTYIIQGLPQNYAVVGDALLAGSIGEAFVSYAEALHDVCQHILTLRGNTILCPGHGPLTTVAEEKQHNPFFAEQAAMAVFQGRAGRSLSAAGP